MKLLLKYGIPVWQPSKSWCPQGIQGFNAYISYRFISCQIVGKIWRVLFSSVYFCRSGLRCMFAFSGVPVISSGVSYISYPSYLINEYCVFWYKCHIDPFPFCINWNVTGKAQNIHVHKVLILTFGWWNIYLDQTAP